ncbi:MAG: B12-binding domain-containing protein, partial [Phycisphaerales bacterium JB064]
PRLGGGMDRGCTMCTDALRERFFDVLVSGDRVEARQVVLRALETGDSAEELITELYWPTYERVEKLFRNDLLSKLGHHYATRLLRVLADQTAGLIQPAASNGRTIIAVCGPRDSDDLAGQLATDMLVSRGFTVHFGGGGIPNDELLAEIKLRDPSALLLFASGANDLPFIRELIDTIHEEDPDRNMQVAVGGGVFNRADGLAAEIGADLWGEDPLAVVEALIEEWDVRAMPRPRRRRRKSAA